MSVKLQETASMIKLVEQMHAQSTLCYVSLCYFVTPRLSSWANSRESFGTTFGVRKRKASSSRSQGSRMQRIRSTRNVMQLKRGACLKGDSDGHVITSRRAAGHRTTST